MGLSKIIRLRIKEIENSGGIGKVDASPSVATTFNKLINDLNILAKGEEELNQNLASVESMLSFSQTDTPLVITGTGVPIVASTISIESRLNAAGTSIKGIFAATFFNTTGGPLSVPSIDMVVGGDVSSPTISTSVTLGLVGGETVDYMMLVEVVKGTLTTINVLYRDGKRGGVASTLTGPLPNTNVVSPATGPMPLSVVLNADVGINTTGGSFNVKALEGTIL